jgi:hypothetical protein
MMGFKVVDGRRNISVEESYPDCKWQHEIDCTLKATLPSACSAYRLAWDRAMEDAVTRDFDLAPKAAEAAYHVHLYSR